MEDSLSIFSPQEKVTLIAALGREDAQHWMNEVQKAHDRDPVKFHRKRPRSLVALALKWKQNALKGRYASDAVGADRPSDYIKQRKELLHAQVAVEKREHER